VCACGGVEEEGGRHKELRERGRQEGYWGRERKAEGRERLHKLLSLSCLAMHPTRFKLPS